MGPGFQGRDDGYFYCAFGLIAHDTLTVTKSVSSPCATGAPAAIGAAILPRNTGVGAPSSEMLMRLAERHAGGLGKDRGLAAGIRNRLLAGFVQKFEACETVKLMPPISLAPAPTRMSITLATLVTSRS